MQYAYANLYNVIILCTLVYTSIQSRRMRVYDRYLVMTLSLSARLRSLGRSPINYGQRGEINFFRSFAC